MTIFTRWFAWTRRILRHTARLFVHVLFASAFALGTAFAAQPDSKGTDFWLSVLLVGIFVQTTPSPDSGEAEPRAMFPPCPFEPATSFRSMDHGDSKCRETCETRLLPNSGVLTCGGTAMLVLWSNRA